MKQNLLFNRASALTKRLAMVLTVLLTLGVGSMLGAEVTFTTAAYNGKGGSSGTGGSATSTSSGVTITSTKAYYTSAHIREYSGGTITVSSSNNITKIVFTSTASGTNSNGPGKISLNSGGGGYSYSGTAGTWTGSSTSIKFNCTAQFRWTKIVVTTEDASCTEPTITFSNASYTVGGSVLDLSDLFTSNSDGAVTYSVANANGTGAAISGANFTATAAGSATVTATQAAKGSYCEGSATATITVNKQQTTITLSEAGSTTTPSGTFYIGDSYTLPYSTDAECGDKTFVGWSTVTIDNSANKPTSDFYAPGVSVTLGANNTFYAVFAESGGVGSTSWVETDIANIAANDEVVITMSNTTDMWALSHEKGSSDAPPADRFTDNTFDDVADVYIWNISNDNGSLIIYPKGSTSTWLYCTATNNGVRVGTNANKAFTISGDYLKNTATSRYVGVYTTNPDWRCYTSTTGNIANQTLAFYKKTTTGGYQNYTTECTTETAR